jgi:hypothetical protein
MTDPHATGSRAAESAPHVDMACSVLGCGNKALLAESIVYRGLEVWVYICGAHMVERRKAENA